MKVATRMIALSELARRTTNLGELRNYKRRFEHLTKELRDEFGLLKKALEKLFPQPRAEAITPLPRTVEWEAPRVDAVPPPPEFLALIRGKAMDSLAVKGSEAERKASDGHTSKNPEAKKLWPAAIPRAAWEQLRQQVERPDDPPSPPPQFVRRDERTPGHRATCACALCTGDLSPEAAAADAPL